MLVHNTLLCSVDVIVILDNNNAYIKGCVGGKYCPHVLARGFVVDRI